MKKLVVSASLALASTGVFAAGFGLYEASARGNALGGALIGSTKDASAVYYNPANMTETTNVSVMVGATFVGLYADVDADNRSAGKMNPGIFTIPHLFVSTPVWQDLYFGLGFYCEDGLGTMYNEKWALASDTVETTLEEFTINPNLAYKITDWWSVAAGLKASYITFENRKHPHAGTPYVFTPSEHGLPSYYPIKVYPNAYRLTSQLDGDGWTMGYNFGTTFKLLESRDYGTLKLGVVYRSMLKHTIRGAFDLDGTVLEGENYYGYSLEQKMHQRSKASARLDLPQSLAAGLNWDSPNNVWHVGFATTWTQWSSVDSISFHIPNYGYTLPLEWEDVWRFAWGVEYNLTDDWLLRASYVYDMDPSSEDYGTTMLPGGDRHIIGLGTGYYIWRTLRIDLSYNLVMMEPSERYIDGDLGSTKFSIDNAYSHMVGVSLSYAF